MAPHQGRRAFGDGVGSCDADFSDSIKTLEAKLRDPGGQPPPREQFERVRQHSFY